MPSDPQPHSGFPTTRMRRLRYHPQIRRLVRDVHLSADNLVLPLFVHAGNRIRRPIDSLPGHFQWSVDQLDEIVGSAVESRLGGVILFGISEHKDATGTDSTSDGGIVQQAARAIKKIAPDLLVITDVCLCEYTDHGHCGVVNSRSGRAEVDNDATLELLAAQAVSHARAGADLVAPSGMMDGMVGAIRRGLDSAGLTHVPVMSYAAKYASAFYGPFREAAGSARAIRRSPGVSNGSRSGSRAAAA